MTEKLILIYFEMNWAVLTPKYDQKKKCARVAIAIQSVLEIEHWKKWYEMNMLKRGWTWGHKKKVFESFVATYFFTAIKLQLAMLILR